MGKKQEDGKKQSLFTKEKRRSEKIKPPSYNIILNLNNALANIRYKDFPNNHKGKYAHQNKGNPSPLEEV